MKNFSLKSHVYRSMNLVALVLACLLTTLPGCGEADPSTAKLKAPTRTVADQQQPRPEPDVPQPAPTRLTCQEKQGRSYVAPSEIPTWDDSMRIMMMHKCLPCHNNNFAAAGLLLRDYEEHKVAAKSSSDRIKAGLLKPLASHETYSIQLWLLNGLPRSKDDLKDWDEDRCVTLP